ncbi:MAG: hypothetical protein IJY27_02045 [Clostridia bacterium]|nr:hypothetical protein [Clostridia bacterium]
MESTNNFLYLIFSHTNNRMGGVIRTVTRYDYNHVSVALTSNLSKIYSFARHHHDTPFYGGFVCESATRFIKDDTVANVKIYAIPVSERQHRIAKNYINKVEREKGKYLYNMFSAATFPFHRRVNIDRAYTCVEFAVSVLRRIGAPRHGRISRFCSIEQLDQIYADYQIYEGSFPSYAGSPAESDGYMRKNTVRYRVGHTVGSNARLFGRLFRRLWHSIIP